MKRFVVLLCMMLCPTFTNAADVSICGTGNAEFDNVSSCNSSWGNAGDIKLSGTDISSNIQISSVGAISDTGSTYTHFKTIHVLAARTVTNYGVKLCPTQITVKYEEKNSNRRLKSLDTGFSSISGNCIWLCKDGYGGTPKTVSGISNVECTIPPNDLTVENSGFNKQTEINDVGYFGYIGDSTTYNGANMSIFKSNSFSSGDAGSYCCVDGCQIITTGTKPTFTFYNILVNKKFLQHGMIVQQATVKPVIYHGADEKFGYSKADLYYTGSETLVCLPGYKPNSSNTDCELLDKFKEACADIPKPNANTTWTTKETGVEHNGDYTCIGTAGTDQKTHYWQPNQVRCAAGYYGTASKSYQTVSGQRQYKTTGCTVCPSGGTSDVGNNATKTKCYRNGASSEYRGTNGYYKESERCYWAE